MKTITIRKLKDYQTTRWNISNSRLSIETPRDATSADVIDWFSHKIMNNPAFQVELGILGCDNVRFKVRN